MISAGYPAGVFSLHPGPSDEDILNRIIQAMAHVQHPGNIGRWNHNSIRFPVIGFAVKVSFAQPVLVPMLLGLLVLKIFAQFFHGKSCWGSPAKGCK